MAQYTEYGNFSSDNSEFVIKRIDTPRPWINYLSNGKYCAIISHTGGGYSFYLDPGVNRVSRWSSENYMKDTPGRYLYIRDQESNQYWSSGVRPVGKSQGYECRHGLGYTTIKNSYAEVSTELTCFVPWEESAEVWLAKIKNLSNRERSIKVFPFMEWSMGQWMPEISVRNLYILVNQGVFDAENQMIITRKFPWGGKEHLFLGFMGSSLKVKGYDIDYENFIGQTHSYQDPVVLERGTCTNSTARGMNMVGVFEHELRLKPQEEVEFSVIIGLAPMRENDAAIKAGIKKSAAVVDKYRDISYVKSSLNETKNRWQKLLHPGRVHIETPDEQLNRSVNVWMKYQITMNNHWGRSASYYHEGWGEFGYRNTSQDAWSMIPLDPEYAKERLIQLAEHQKKNGQPLPGWSLSLGPSTHRPPSDFPIWLPMLLISYLKETGDFKILKKKVKYFDGGSATLYEHAKKATEFLQDIDRSARGLPLMGTQDWNDAFDRTGIGGKGESIWLGMGLCVALKNLEELSTFLGEKSVAKDCRVRYEKMKTLLNKYAWDGDWYCYAYNDLGQPLGSKKNKEGSIQLNAQTWAIIAGLPDDVKLKKILKVIDQDLDTPYGPVLFTPPYTKYNHNIGRITAFAPGTKENGAIFCHGGAFKAFSDCALGRGDQAYDTIKKMLPASLDKDIELYKTEPYVFPEYIIGPGNRRYGEGAFSWLTGSVDWFFITITDKILGAQPDFAGLRIDPCLPKSWKDAKIFRTFRGACYEIRIKNRAGVNRGIQFIKVDGQKIESNLIPPHGDGKNHLVEVEMGR